MRGADKVICQAAAVFLLFAMTSAPAKAQFGGMMGGGRRRGHDDPDGADAGDDEGADGQAPLRDDDADHGTDDGRQRRRRSASAA